MTHLRRDEGGSALVTAVVVIALMTMMGIPLLDMIDSTQRRTTSERVSDTAYNVAEAGLTAQSLVLTAAWPHTAGRALPLQCVRASTSGLCPQAASLAKDFMSTDFDAKSDWGVEVRDNTGTSAAYYDRAALAATSCGVPGPCTWDSNGDGIMWVRAKATVRGRSRTLVAQVRQQIVRFPIPRNVVTAGRLTTTNNGRKTLVDGKGCLAKSKPTATCNNVQPAPVVVRCQTTTPAVASDLCLGYVPEQVSPNLYLQDPGAANLLSSTELDQVRAAAIQAGTYRNTCPATVADVTGSVVFLEPAGPTSPPLICVFGANGVANSAAAPGMLIVNHGSVSFSGTFDFYGIVYLANHLAPPADAGNLLAHSGNAYIQGGVFVDGNGGVAVGSSGLNLSFDENAFGGLKGINGNASTVQNSFRELPAGQ
jgi:Tfp pilus assembly protein PilX